jgi:tetraacyldisaccharide 4'-kinase
LLDAEDSHCDPAKFGIDPFLPVIHAALEPIAGERLAGARLLAFAGIGRPVKFFATLEGLGATLVDTRSLPDHHSFRAGEIDELRRTAERARARLITTPKDIVRVPAEMRAGIEVLEVEIRWRDPDAPEKLLRSVAGT